MSHGLFFLQFCDRFGYVHLISNFGNLCTIAFLLLIGPMPLFKLDLTIAMTRGLMILFGAGDALQMVTSFTRAYKSAIDSGYEDNIETTLMVSGIVHIQMWNVFELIAFRFHLQKVVLVVFFW